MKLLYTPIVAVIADAHLHDIHSDYDGAGLSIGDRQLTLRTWADTRSSSRVFNESRLALTGALNDIVKRGIKHVVLLGDYADDGQIEAIARVVAILRQYRDEYDISFYSLPGNHDYYGPAGKHQSTRFAVSAQQSVLVTSDPETAELEPDSAVLTRKMFCLGAPEGLLPMAEFGYCHQPAYLHWETPFGTSDKFSTRRYLATSSDGANSYSLVDASYLVEPAPGLWLLMLDVNVFEPRNGQRSINQKKAFIDRSDAGWNSVLRNKPYLFEWIGDVCRRAKEQEKHLLTFSHYPALDPYNDHEGGYLKLFGETEVSRRQPEIMVAKKLQETGLRLHFGGHMHINGVGRFGTGAYQLTNVSVPSLVNCPAAYQLIQANQKEVRIDTISLTSLALDSDLLGFYRQECLSSQEPIDAALNATDYGDFLYQRIHSRLLHRYFKKHWPSDIVQNIQGMSVADLLILFLMQETSNDAIVLCTRQTSANTELFSKLLPVLDKHNLNLKALSDLPIVTLIQDWYCLRDTGDQALTFITPERLSLYRFICSYCKNSVPTEIKNTSDFFAVFLGMMHTMLQALPQELSPIYVDVEL